MARLQLNLVNNSPLAVAGEDLEAMAAGVRALAPEIDVRIASRRRSAQWRLLSRALRPSLTVAFGRARPMRIAHGQLLDCPRYTKHVEIEMLRAAGVPAPETVVIEPHTALDPGTWGPYVIVKPDLGQRGIEVRIRRTERVRYAPPAPLEGVSPKHPTAMIAQRFVYTGPWAVSYRVCTFFGRALYGLRVEQSHEKRRLESRFDFAGSEGGVQVVAPSRTSSYALCDDAEIIAAAERAHRLAFPDYPYLGFDLARDADSGEILVLEANSGGTILHLSSETGRSVQRDHGLDLRKQFGALERAAERLVEVTRRRARVAPFGWPRRPARA